MGFIEDYLDYNDGNECPKQYHLWAALSLLAVATGKRTYFLEGGSDSYRELTYYPNLYICLVGPQGGRKSVAKDIARGIVLDHLPDTPLSASVDTARSITQYMSSEECLRAYTDESGCVQEWRPIYLIINELKNFLGRDPIAIIDFLVDIYDQKAYKYRTAHMGTDFLINPCVNVLGCATTEYIVDQLRDRILSGLSRRMLFVNIIEEFERKPIAVVPEGGRLKLQRAIQHLKGLEKVAGCFAWKDANAFNAYKHWYTTYDLPTEPHMAGFYRSKKLQVIKVSMLLALAKYPPQLFITADDFLTALEIVTNTESGMTKLFYGAGRNVLALPMQRMMTILERSAIRIPELDIEIRGVIQKKKLQVQMDSSLQPFEQVQVIEHLRRTDQIEVRLEAINGVSKEYIFTKDAIEKLNRLRKKPTPSESARVSGANPQT